MVEAHTWVQWRTSSHSGQEGECVEVGAWRKSTHSTGNGGECVEVGAWRMSSWSTDQGNCVEVAADEAVVLARDSKDPGRPVKTGHLDLP